MIEGLPATTALRGTNLHLTISVRLQGAAGVLQALVCSRTSLENLAGRA
jgi:hypothetical protein